MCRRGVCCAVLCYAQVVHDSNGGTTVSDLTLIDVNTPQVRIRRVLLAGPASRLHTPGAHACCMTLACTR